MAPTLRGMSHVPVFNETLKQAFLDTLRETCNVTLSAQAVGIATGTAYKHRKDDPLFAERWDEALAEGIDLLEHLAHKRAFQGVEEPVFNKGEVAGFVTKYSDSLTMFLLKAHRPDKYRERSEVKQQVSGDLNLNDTTRAARLAALLELAKKRASAAEDFSDLV